MKRYLMQGLLLAIVVSLILAGCSPATDPGDQGNNDKPTPTAHDEPADSESYYPDYLNLDSEFPIVKEGENITISVLTATNSAMGGKTEDIWFWKFCKEKMNISFDVEQVMDSAVPEKKNLMLASGDMRDIMFNMGITTSDLVTYGQIEKKLYDLNSLLTLELAPNLLSLFEKFPTLKASLSCPDSGVYTFPKIGLVNDPGGVKRLFINKEWLDNVNLSVPETLEDFYEVLKAFKDKDPSGTGRIVPLGGNYKDYDPSVFILSALGFVTNGISYEPAIRNGKVEIPCGSELYKEYLTFMNRLYTEGLLDENFFTIDRTQADAQLAEKLVGIIQCPAPYLVLPDVEDFQQYIALSPVTSDHNQEKVWAGPNSFIVGTAVVSANAEHPEVVMRFMDYIYSQEGGVYSWNGAPANRPEDTLGIYEGWTLNDAGGEDYPEVASGKYESPFEIIQRVISPFSSTMGNRSDIINDKRIICGLEPFDEPVFDITNGDNFFRKSVTENILPFVKEPYPNNLYFTEEENIRLSDLKTVISDFVINETSKFITGANSLSNIEQFYNDLYALEFEEYQNLYVKAYENYLSNLSQ